MVSAQPIFQYRQHASTLFDVSQNIPTPAVKIWFDKIRLDKKNFKQFRQLNLSGTDTIKKVKLHANELTKQEIDIFKRFFGNKSNYCIFLHVIRKSISTN